LTATPFLKELAHEAKQEMKYLSVCSGIESASVAWEPLGWVPAGFSEIEPFPSAVLAKRWPKVRNYGDMTKYENWKKEIGTIDLLVGGTPCQSFSLAGLRQGLKDPRGNLMLTFLEIAKCYGPRWIVWENVPGVLSSNGGRDFGSFLGALGQLGYGWAYRVLDAQWCGLAQRRKRVFVVGCLGDEESARKVLFECESVCRNPAPSREARQGVATNVEAGFGVSPTITQCKGSRGGCSDEALMEITAVHQAINAGIPGALVARDYKGVAGRDFDPNKLVCEVIPIHDQATRNAGKRGNKQDGKGNGLGVGKAGDPSPTLTKCDKHSVAYSFDALSSNSMKSKNPHSGCREVDLAGVLDTTIPEPSKNQGGLCIVSPAITQCKGGRGGSRAEGMAFQQNTRDEVRYINGDGAIAGALSAETGSKQQNYIHIQQSNEAIAMRESGQGYWMEDDKSGTLRAEGENRPSRPSHVIAQVAFPIDSQNMTEGHSSGGKGFGESGDPSFTLTKAHSHAVAVDTYNHAIQDKAIPIRSTASDVCHTGGVINPSDRMAVRRLTPKECERLQGFSDDYTLIPWRNKPEDQCPDGPRYKALGNSMAVNCMRWIGERIDKVHRKIS
jgi:DNA (cytosine-5)-methyltransferase 1